MENYEKKVSHYLIYTFVLLVLSIFIDGEIICFPFFFDIKMISYIHLASNAKIFRDCKQNKFLFFILLLKNKHMKISIS